MSTTCKYCNGPENKQDRPGLVCEACVCFVHLNCLRRQGTPGNFACDVFFDFTCEDCSPEQRELLKRNKFPWVNVLLLTLNHHQEQMQGISNNGFFHYKTHICSFIDRYWLLLFGTRFKQKKNWVGTIAGVLSVYNNTFFRSGSGVLRETGWWKLQHAFSPALAAYILQELTRDRPKGRVRTQLALNKTLFIQRVTDLGYGKYLREEDPPAHNIEPGPSKKRRLDSDALSGVSSSSNHDQYDSDIKTEYQEEFYESPLLCLNAKHTGADVETMFRGFEFRPASFMQPSDTSSVHSDSHSSHNPTDGYSDEDKHKDTKKPDTKPKKEEHVEYPRESLFSTQLNSVDMPWMEELPETRKDLVPMTAYEEVQLLKNVQSLIPKVKDPDKKAHLYRLKAKLSVRRQKRHKHLPIFDLDKTVKLLGGYVTEDPKMVVNTERVLDRFQRSYLLDNLSGTVAASAGGPLLVSRLAEAPLRSPHSGALLKPYIRRDTDTAPPWLRLMDELLRRTHRQCRQQGRGARGSIDYSYVRPHHLPAVNALCAQHFWPGIDLSEALQYPEYSCVVSYRRVVVACAFLVPEGPRAAYISFVVTRPEWRRAGIATFMLYHLLQTCPDKDVTLHVSPTNPAIFLYQKFGFKVEELIQDFYEKYYDIDYKGCRHALFLRLTR